MKQHYVTIDITPSADIHFMTEDFSPDMASIVYFKGQCISPETAKKVKSLFGADSVGVIDFSKFPAYESTYTKKLENKLGLTRFVKVK